MNKPTQSPAAFNLEAAINDLAAAASAMALAIDGLEVVCRGSSPSEYQFRGLRWLAREAETLAEGLYETLYPDTDPVSGSA